jgi:hypothetical protein
MIYARSNTIQFYESDSASESELGPDFEEPETAEEMILREYREGKPTRPSDDADEETLVVYLKAAIEYESDYVDRLSMSHNIVEWHLRELKQLKGDDAVKAIIASTPLHQLGYSAS